MTAEKMSLAHDNVDNCVESSQEHCENGVWEECGLLCFLIAVSFQT